MYVLSLLVQERGLKLSGPTFCGGLFVAPCTGAWIETSPYLGPENCFLSLLVQERGLKPFKRTAQRRFSMSLLVQERGLKLNVTLDPAISVSRSLYRSVD